MTIELELELEGKFKELQDKWYQLKRSQAIARLWPGCFKLGAVKSRWHRAGPSLTLVVTAGDQRRVFNRIDVPAILETPEVIDDALTWLQHYMPHKVKAFKRREI